MRILVLPLMLQQHPPRLLAIGMLAIAVMAMVSMPAVAQLAPSATDSRAAAYSAKGRFAVEVSDAVWRDTARSRDLPIRILFPREGADARYPIIFFSHGLGGSREGGALWGQHWASHGYIVIHLQHPGSDEAIWKGKPPGEARDNLRRAMSVENSRLRSGDIAFVLDEIVRLQAAQVAPFNRADISRIGMSGHSFGAQTTLAVAGQRLPLQNSSSVVQSRIAAAIAFSPNARVKTDLNAQFGSITMPLLSITGTRDGGVLGDGTRYEDRLLPFQNMPPGNKYLLSFLDGDHMVFGGHALGARRAETARDREIQIGVNAATLAFWNATLKQDDTAKNWLQQEFKSMLVEGDVFIQK